jgi:DNA-binding LacI/PurR family transcriptional regulator
MAGEHLLSLGRRRIAFIGQADEHYPEFADRYRGLCAALGQVGIASDPALQCDALNFEDAGSAAVEALLATGAKFDAIFAASDLIAIGALRALAAAELRVPADVAIVGFDNQPAASMSNPPLTTLMQDLKAAGELLVETLLAQIEDRPLDNRTIPAQLIARRSTLG